MELLLDSCLDAKLVWQSCFTPPPATKQLLKYDPLSKSNKLNFTCLSSASQWHWSAPHWTALCPPGTRPLQGQGCSAWSHRSHSPPHPPSHSAAAWSSLSSSLSIIIICHPPHLPSSDSDVLILDVDTLWSYLHCQPGCAAGQSILGGEGGPSHLQQHHLYPHCHFGLVILRAVITWHCQWPSSSLMSTSWTVRLQSPSASDKVYLPGYIPTGWKCINKFEEGKGGSFKILSTHLPILLPPALSSFVHNQAGKSNIT